MSSRTYHDPLHGGIALNTDDPAEALVLELVDELVAVVEGTHCSYPSGHT